MEVFMAQIALLHTSIQPLNFFPTPESVNETFHFALKKLQKGVNIANIRLESFKIMDTELANEIAQNCLTTAHVEYQLSNLQGQNLSATQKERANCEKIKALSKATALQTRSDAENARRIEAAKAEAEEQRCQTIIQAQAEADAILCKAKAEAEALCLKPAAEAKRLSLLRQAIAWNQSSQDGRS